MLLYHGTEEQEIDEFDLKHTRKEGMDFGVGVYLTSNYIQAKKWSCKNKKQEGAVYVFDINFKGAKIILKKFNRLEEDLYYVLYLCRLELEDIACFACDKFDNVDIVVGPLLDGNMRDEFIPLAEKFNEGDIEFDEFFKSVKLYSESKDQYCFKTENAITLLNKSLKRREITKQIKNKIEIIETKYFNQGK